MPQIILLTLFGALATAILLILVAIVKDLASANLRPRTDETHLATHDPLPENAETGERASAPLSLGIVALLFILDGGFALVQIIVELTHGNLDCDLTVLGIFIGLGLLRFSRGWRTCALVFTWIALIGIPLVAIIFACNPGPFDVNVFGQKVGTTDKEVCLLLALLAMTYAIWQYRVLTRPNIRKLFGLPGA